MFLTRNEKKVLKLLLDNAKLSDTSIANKLNITSQAVGRIRKKLEENIITGYTLSLDYSKLGINIIAIGHTILTPEGNDLEKGEVNKKILDEPHIVALNELLGEEHSHLIIMAFRDLEDFKDFFNSKGEKDDLHKFIKIKKMHCVPISNLLKNNIKPLVIKCINELGVKNSKETNSNYIKRNSNGF